MLVGRRAHLKRTRACSESPAHACEQHMLTHIRGHAHTQVRPLHMHVSGTCSQIHMHTHTHTCAPPSHACQRHLHVHRTCVQSVRGGMSSLSRASRGAPLMRATSGFCSTISASRHIDSAGSASAAPSECSLRDHTASACKGQRSR